MTELYDIAIQRAREALKRHGYTIEMETRVNEGRNIVFAVSTPLIMETFFYYKFEQQPLQINEVFDKAGVTINAEMFEQYIRTHEMDILYYYGQQDTMFVCRFKSFTANMQPLKQPYNDEPVYIHELRGFEEW